MVSIPRIPHPSSVPHLPHRSRHEIVQHTHEYVDGQTIVQIVISIIVDEQTIGQLTCDFVDGQISTKRSSMIFNDLLNDTPTKLRKQHEELFNILVVFLMDFPRQPLYPKSSSSAPTIYSPMLY
jgi:hypothetical protein